MRKLNVVDPAAWPHYWLFRALGSLGTCLEIGPGLYPQFDLASSEFIDINPEVCAKIKKVGGRIREGSAQKLPFEDNQFDLIGCFYVLHLLSEESRTLREIIRVLRPGGCLLLSVPVNNRKWSFKDERVNSFRRYDPEAFLGQLEQMGFRVEGVIPQGGWLSDLARHLEHLFFQIVPEKVYAAVMHDLAVAYYKLKILMTPQRGREFVPRASLTSLDSYSGLLLLLKLEFKNG